MKHFLLTFLLAVSVQAASKNAPKGESVFFKATEGRTEFFAIGKPSMIKINGEAQGPEGRLTASKNSLSGSVKVDLNQLTTKNDLRDEHVKNKYLEVSKFPEAILEFINLQLPMDFANLSDKETEVPFTAKFTMHGKTSDVTGTAKIARIAARVAGNAQFVFKITSHLDTLPSWLGVKVAEDVTVKVQLKGVVQ
ncbi:MAG: YceI family protein [Pseudobdellovibrio sp.]|nr:YceI family protein [Pseudobdellovibrio sp.]